MAVTLSIQIQEKADENYPRACIEAEKRTNELCEAYENFLGGKKRQWI